MAVKFSAVTCSEAEPRQISKMNCSVKIVNSLTCLRFSGKTPSHMYERVLPKKALEMFYKVFLEILQNSQENTGARDSFFL